MIQDALKVRMLGGFTLEYKGREIILDRNIASKTMQLLQIMLLHTGDGGISKTALIEALYGRKEVENKNGSLNNTLFRLRKQLKNAGLPESNYIIINSGICTWDSQIKVSVDVLEFEQLIIQGKAEKKKRRKSTDLDQSRQTLYRRVFAGHDRGRLGGSRECTFPGYVCYLYGRTVSLSQNRRAIRRTSPGSTCSSEYLSL